MALKKEKKPKAEVEPEDAAAGKLASLGGAPPDANPMPKKTAKKPKLAKHDKSRLPRKQKKAQQKAGRARKG
jgi:hypothetical protein